MNTSVSVSVCKISKKFKLFHSRKHRLAEALHPFRKRYHDEFWALKDISFDIYHGEVVGIVGRNGSGKSTILQIICSILKPTSGEIRINGKVSALLNLGSGFNSEFTGRNNVLLNGALMDVSRSEMLNRLPEVEAFADIGDFFDQPMKIYSSGMHLRVAFAAAIYADPDILVIDEMLSVGDTKFQEKCFRRIKSIREAGGTIVFVSHDLNCVSSLCDRVILLDQGTVVLVAPPVEAIPRYFSMLYPQVSPIEDSQIEAPQMENYSNVVDEDKEISESISSFLSQNNNEEKFHLGNEYNNNEERIYSGIAPIIDYMLTCDGEVLENALLPRERTISLFLKIFSSQDIEECYCGYAINSTHGVKIFAQSNKLGPNQFGFKLRSGTITSVRFDFINKLNSGSYFINVGLEHLVGAEMAPLDWRKSALMIEVGGSQHVDGFCDLRAGDMKIFQPN